ncbi:MAG: division/cell wall cluster transcriptional repressor MraZ [Planctomycetota bacterium]|nr:MAG: division/cell wall cluster transcriptional repressor MraZ [Planctomycetota bacterium]REJ90309.1 MAG: division/cell wall cluster transcriptional repressor MraZ [Planctomycetota bacterium]REJ95622.1 MAG: division/cell wall cluster transcriptional repressor MraZ [Planctomycetota bacterium]REK25182.1 MAG: division/cell wall cluster transcriptional repressor MraZ [Planctomycetota bacterium]REK40950.1 MAG: division/cell wall cluster transcriptional repressor MraZ [Planctomycetota bacterium]
MAKQLELIVGEFPRSLDERYRVSVPTELAEPLLADGETCILAKERPGCLSLWSAEQWQEKLDAGVDLVRSKIRAGKLEGRLDQVQLFGRLLSTRQREVKIAGRGRLLIPEGFREFLAVEPGGDLLVIGAAVCVELWRPDAWLEYLNKRIPRFKRLFEELAS